MVTPLLTTKLYIPPVRRDLVSRSRLIERLNEGLHRGGRLTLVSALAGFGKTTLLSEWVVTGGRPVAWLALDGGDNDPARFLAYLIAALQTIEEGIGAGVLDRFQALTELRLADLGFTQDEAMAFLNQVMGLRLSSASVFPRSPLTRICSLPRRS